MATDQLEMFPEDHELNRKGQRRRQLRDVLQKAREDKAGRGQGRPPEDLTGQRFGKLALIAMTDERKAGAVVFLAACDCGEIIKVSRANLRTGLTHCGCMGTFKDGLPRPGTLGCGGVRSSQMRHITRKDWTKAFNSMFKKYQHAAASRGYSWELSEEEFFSLSQQPCHYCGAAPAQEHKAGAHTWIYNGVDRVDNSQGYAIKNCVACCGECNIAKGARNGAEFLAWIERVYRRQQKAG